MCQIQGLEERLSPKLRTKELFNFTLDGERHANGGVCGMQLGYMCEQVPQVPSLPVAQDDGQQQVLQREPFVC